MTISTSTRIDLLDRDRACEAMFAAEQRPRIRRDAYMDRKERVRMETMLDAAVAVLEARGYAIVRLDGSQPR